MALHLRRIAGTQRSVAFIATGLALLAGLAGALVASRGLRRDTPVASASAVPSPSREAGGANGAVRSEYVEEIRTEPIRPTRWSLSVRVGEDRRDGSAGADAPWIERVPAHAHRTGAERGSALDRAWGVQSPGLPAPSSRAPPIG